MRAGRRRRVPPAARATPTRARRRRGRRRRPTVDEALRRAEARRRHRRGTGATAGGRSRCSTRRPPQGRSVAAAASSTDRPQGAHASAPTTSTTPPDVARPRRRCRCRTRPNDRGFQQQVARQLQQRPAPTARTAAARAARAGERTRRGAGRPSADGAPGGRLPRPRPPPAGRRARPSGLEREVARPRAARSRAAPSRWPAASTGSCGCSRRGATSTAGRSPARGERLVRIYHECDLLIAEALEPGLLDDLDPAVAGRAGLVLHLRAPQQRRRPPPPWFPSAERARTGSTQIEQLAAELQRRRGGAGLPLTRPPDPGVPRAGPRLGGGRATSTTCSRTRSSRAATSSATSSSSSTCCARSADAAPTRPRPAPPAQAADALFRGVVAASSVVDRRRMTVEPIAGHDDREGRGLGRAGAAARRRRRRALRRRGPRRGRARPGGPASRCPPLGLLGGDLCRTLGGPGDEAAAAVGRGHDASRRPRRGPASTARLHWFVAHLVARRSWWRGRVVAAMNAQWLGALGPRPRGPSERRPARHRSTATCRSASGSKARRAPADRHPPARTPASRSAGSPAAQVDARPALDVWLDGERRRPGRARCRSASSPTPSPCVV